MGKLFTHLISITALVLAVGCGGGSGDKSEAPNPTPEPPQNSAPTISITSPENNSNFNVNDTLTFTATAQDDEDGNISNDIIWFSDIHGEIGKGASITASLDAAVHVITAEVSDSEGLEARSQINIDIFENTGFADISWVAPSKNTNDTDLTDLAGFKVYYGQSQDTLNNFVTIENPQALNYRINNLATQRTYYFAVTAYNSLGTESEPSEIVNKEISE